jgi:hypothetical protein
VPRSTVNPERRHPRPRANALQVTNGPTYTLALTGGGYKPKLSLSFLNWDFGSVHVFQQGMTPASVKLGIVNEDRQPVSFDTAFDNTDTWQVCVCVLCPVHRAALRLRWLSRACLALNLMP